MSTAESAPDGFPITAIRESWEDINQYCLDLSGMILNHCLETGERFDKMLILPRGSYHVANIVARELNFGAVDILHAGIGSYKAGMTDRNGTFELGQMPTEKEVEGMNLLIIEEVCDTGHTLSFLTDLLELAKAGIVRTGVMHYKPQRNLTGFLPTWFVQSTDEWVVYPWEQNEARGRQVNDVKRKLHVVPELVI